MSNNLSSGKCIHCIEGENQLPMFTLETRARPTILALVREEWEGWMFLRILPGTEEKAMLLVGITS